MYDTEGDLQDGNGARFLRHIAMSLPTSFKDDRLPLAVDLDRIETGVRVGDANLTDPDGYNHDGTSRYISLYHKENFDFEPYTSFFNSSNLFISAEFSFPQSAGIEHKLSSASSWDRPELSHDSTFFNVRANGSQGDREPRPILFTDGAEQLFTHRQRLSGTHIYQSYGINIFSRARNSDVEVSITTNIKQKNALVPPTNVNAHIIQEERPLMLTSQSDQDRLSALTSADKTLLRVRFDYNTNHELKSYKISAFSRYSNAQLLSPGNRNNPDVLFPDDKEIYADKAEIFFRPDPPYSFSGKIVEVNPVAGDNNLSQLRVSDYQIASNNTTQQPLILSGSASNFIGSVIVIQGERFLIHSLDTIPENLSKDRIVSVMVYKKVIGDSFFENNLGHPSTSLVEPEIRGDGYFICVENLTQSSSWGAANPSSFEIDIHDGTVHRELIQFINSDGDLERHVEKSRGFWFDNAVIDNKFRTYVNSDGSNTVDEIGQYTIIVSNHNFPEFPVASSSNLIDAPVVWSNGIVRLHLDDSLVNGVYTKYRKSLKVLKIGYAVENDPTSDLILTCFDESFRESDTDNRVFQMGTISVNFYPGYKAYFLKDDSLLLNEANILPVDQPTKKSIVGVRIKGRAQDHNTVYQSKISSPYLIEIAKRVEAKVPLRPKGGAYATKVDIYGRSSFTFETEYVDEGNGFFHQPFAVQFYRTSDHALLNALYSPATITAIKMKLNELGGRNNEYFANRWLDMFDFDNLYNNGHFSTFPDDDTYSFPNPDKVKFFEYCNAIIINFNDQQDPQDHIDIFLPSEYGTLPAGHDRLKGFVKGAILSSYYPLTEVPINTKYIKDEADYVPIDKKQVFKGSNDQILSPLDPDFDLAPMMKQINDSPYTYQFTDFKLDGTSDHFYFYASRELSSEMKLGGMSAPLGPVYSVNSNPPDAPEIRSLVPVIANLNLNINPKISVEINPYPVNYNIQKIELYRTDTPINSRHIRTMTKVSEKVLNPGEISSSTSWRIDDDFQDLLEIPYGKQLFYRVIASRKLKYQSTPLSDLTSTVVVEEYQPSYPSKVVGTLMPDAALPDSPVLDYSAYDISSTNFIDNLILLWNKTCVDGIYHIFKMSSNGNWTKIASKVSNDMEIQIPLIDTSFANTGLTVANGEGNPVFHHFKVIAENSNGLLSTQQKILTIPSKPEHQIPGIGTMILGDNFIIS